MGSRLRKAGIVFVGVVVVFLAAGQLVRPARTNPPTDPNRTLQAHPGVPGELISVMNRSCGDCHSNTTEWSRYSNVAPMSWIAVYAVNSGRKVMNMSDWASYSADDQRELLFQSCKAATEVKMPGGIYTRIRPEATLSQQDINTICAASRAADASASKTASAKP
jgi:hypothetical protein